MKNQQTNGKPCEKKIQTKKKRKKKKTKEKKMNLSKKDAKNIALTAFGGFATFATLAIGNTLIRRKLVRPLKTDTKYLFKGDELLMVLLAHIEDHVYESLDPVAYIRLVDSCDEIVGIKIKLQGNKKPASNLLDFKIDAFLHLDRAKNNIDRLKEKIKKDLVADVAYLCTTTLERIEKQLDQHYIIINLLTKEN